MSSLSLKTKNKKRKFKSFTLARDVAVEKDLF